MKGIRSFNITLDVNGTTYVFSSSELEMSLETLYEDLSTHAIKGTWIGALMIQCKRYHKIKQQQLKIARATIDAELRLKKKVSETKLKLLIEVDKRYLDIESEMINIEMNYEILREIRDGFKSRKDMLIQVSSNNKLDMNNHNIKKFIARVNRLKKDINKLKLTYKNKKE